MATRRFMVQIVCGFMFVTMSSVASAQHAGHGTAPKEKAPPAPAPKAGRVSEEGRVPVEVPSDQQKKIGLQTAKANRGPLAHVIRTVGSVTADQTREAHVHTRINGWIEKIFVDAIGKPVKKGQTLFELYSPELVSTQEEYLAARGKGETGAEIARAAIERLKGWAVPDSEINRLKSSGKVKRAVGFNAPVDGFVVNKTAIQGMYVTPEMELYYIADLSKVWVLVTLYESDISAIKVGDKTDIKLPYDPAKTFTAPIQYIYPEIDVETRTSKARIELDNKNQGLKPGMYVNVEIKKDLGEAVTVPEDAVIDTGVRRLVFVKTSATRFEPREVKIGPRVEGKYSVLSGLSPGEEVVVSAHFLIDAESKVQAALQKGGGASPGHSGHGSGK